MIRKKIYGEDHVEVATSYDNLASVRDTQREYSSKPLIQSIDERILVFKR